MGSRIQETMLGPRWGTHCPGGLEQRRGPKTGTGLPGLPVSWECCENHTTPTAGKFVIYRPHFKIKSL